MSRTTYKEVFHPDHNDVLTSLSSYRLSSNLDTDWKATFKILQKDAMNPVVLDELIADLIQQRRRKKVIHKPNRRFVRQQADSDLVMLLRIWCKYHLDQPLDLDLPISLSPSTESDGSELEDAGDVIYSEGTKNPAPPEGAAVDQNADNATEVNYTSSLPSDSVVTVDTLNAMVSQTVASMNTSMRASITPLVRVVKEVNSKLSVLHAANAQTLLESHALSKKLDQLHHQNKRIIKDNSWMLKKNIKLKEACTQALGIARRNSHVRKVWYRQSQSNSSRLAKLKKGFTA